MFPFATVERSGGAGEDGADVVVTWEDSLVPTADGETSPLSWRLVVQVKHWRGLVEDTAPIEQIRTKIPSYRALYLQQNLSLSGRPRPVAELGP
jgi:hypothetical protein